MTSLQDTIEREIIVNAPKARVFEAITQPEQLVKWFPDGVEGNLEVGKQVLFDFTEYGKASIYVVASDPNDYFAYRWVPGSTFLPDGYRGDVMSHWHTLVEFRLDEVPGGTRVKLMESGFASIPPEVYEKTMSDNSGGWDYMMDRLAKLLA